MNDMDTLIKELDQLTPAECHDLASRLETKWGVKVQTAAIPTSIPVTQVVEEKSIYDVILKGTEASKKLNVIKELRVAVPGYG